MSRYFLPEELSQLLARARHRGLTISCDVSLIGDYSAAAELITAAGQRMTKPPHVTDDAIHLRFWRRGVDYGVHAFKAVRR